MSAPSKWPLTDKLSQSSRARNSCNGWQVAEDMENLAAGLEEHLRATLEMLKECYVDVRQHGPSELDFGYEQAVKRAEHFLENGQ